MKTKLTFLLSLIFLFFCVSVYGDDFQDGLDAPRKKDYRTAFNLWLPLAEQKYSIAQFNLGTVYDQGKGVAHNLTRAFKLYKVSAEQGYSKAQFNLGGNVS
jgi:uncharacterized protein